MPQVPDLPTNAASKGYALKIDTLIDNGPFAVYVDVSRQTRGYVKFDEDLCNPLIIHIHEVIIYSDKMANGVSKTSQYGPVPQRKW